MLPQPLSAHPATQPSGAQARRFAAFAALLAAVVLLLRIFLTRRLTFCGTPDACFYLGMAQELGSGHGFHARFLYDYQQTHPSLPNTGIEYWRPGISFFLLLARLFGPVTLHSSIALTSLVGVLFAAAAWHVAAQTSPDRRLALASFALCLVLSPSWVGSFTPDSGLFYGAAVAWFLALFTVRRQGLLQDMLALVCVSCAYLIRNDAVLLLVPLLVVLWQRRRRTQRTPASGSVPGRSPAYALFLLFGFALALAPMHLIYHAVLGHGFPSGTARTLFFNELSDFTRYGDPVSAHSLLSHGIKRLLAVRLATFASVLYRVAALTIGYPALVFLPALLLRDHVANILPAPDHSTTHRLPEWTGPVSFAAVALFAYTFALPAIGAFAALRTAFAFMPLTSVLVMLAIARVSRSRRIATVLAGMVMAVNALAGIMQDLRDVNTMNETGEADRREARALVDLGARSASAIVLTNDPVQFSVTTGYAAAPLPSNGLDATQQAAYDLHATHVILDSTNLPASLAEVERQLRPVRSVSLPEQHALVLVLPPAPGAPWRHARQLM